MTARRAVSAISDVDVEDVLVQAIASLPASQLGNRAGSVSVFQNIAISVSVFPHEPTIAYRITPSLTPYALPFPRNGVWALEFALKIADIRDSDIVTIDNL